MKRFEFSLERVLQVKKQRERLAEMLQQQARLAFDAAQAEVDALHAQLARLAQPDGPLSWMARQQQAALVSQAVERAEGRAAQARARLEEAGRARARIATEVEALAHLRQQQWQAFRREQQNAQQAQLDEFGLRRWLDQQAGRTVGG